MKIDFDFLTQKKKDIPFKVKSSISNYKELDMSGRTVSIVANTLNYFDYDFDALAKGCANRSIQNNGAKSQAPDKIAHLLHHDMHRPVGKSMEESEQELDGNSVLMCKSYMPETTDGEDTLIKYETGIYNQHSTGFKYLDLHHLERGSEAWDNWMKELINPEDAEEVGYGWKVNEIGWWEYSTVVFGANKLTPYIGTKSENKVDIADIINQKMTILATKAMRREIKNKKLFDFELAQLQQMILELSEAGSLKDGTQNGSQSESTQKKKITLTGFSNNLKF